MAEILLGALKNRVGYHQIIFLGGGGGGIQLIQLKTENRENGDLGAVVL